jgi:folate-binding protein YgfZ
MSDTASDYAALRHALVALDRGDAGVVEVTGRDRATFLHALVSNDVKSLAPGQGCAATLLDVHGKVQVFLSVWVLDDRILVLTPPGLAASTVDMLDAFLFSEKATLRDATGEFALLVLAGPDVGAAIERLAGVALPGAAWSHVAARIADVDVRLVRGAGESGETEAWIVSKASDAQQVRQAFIEAGARVIGPEAWETARIETGTPAFGADADPTVLLPEIPFADRVSYTKGCYVGQEVVVRIRDRGHVNRMLRGLLIDGETVPPRGARVLAGGTDVGYVTSAVWSQALKRPIALALVRRQQAEPGTGVDVGLADARTAPATVSALPFAR